jgi:large subunit ribosomal protein L22
MEVRSVHRYARISSQKARQVTRAITGMPVSQALNVLDFTPKKAAQLIGKVLRTAIANAENNHELDTEDMVVRSAVATPGPTLKRITPRARGSAGAIKKRLCHITVVLAAGKEESVEGSSTTKVAVKKAAPRKRSAAKKAEQA